MILDRDYPADGPYDIPDEAVLLSAPNATLGSGLSTNDPVTLWRDGVVVSSYVHPINPGDGLSAERIDPDGPDEADNWVPSPCGASPGAANCISSGGAPAGLPSLVVSEVMATPADQATGEFVEIYNYGEEAAPLVGLSISDGDSTDLLIAVAGKESTLPAGGIGVIIDPGYVDTMSGAPYFLDGDVPVVVTVSGAALGNGLSSNDPVVILADDGVTPVATFSHPLAVSQQSVERIDLFEADLADNWMPSPCPERHSAGRANCAAGGGVPVDTPNIVINEVMANPIDEDLGEFVELHNQGDTAADAAGLVLSDGDATDVIGAFPGLAGDTIIPAGGYGVVLDPEYTGGYAIPDGAVLLAPDDTTLGNGLTTNDPIVLLATDGVTELSTYSFPFNPGNGLSVERRGDTGDIESNWVTSTCASGSSPGAQNCVSEGTGPDPDPTVDVVISEVMSNPLDEGKGEFIELVNLGGEAVVLDGFVLSDGDATDTIEGYDGGSTELLAGRIAVILDRDYGALTPAPYEIPAGALLLTTDDKTIGSGLATDDPISLLETDGTTVVATYGFPFNAGNGTSVERVDTASGDSPENWVASPCDSGSSPGAANCAAGGGPVGTVVDVNTATAAELEQVHGIGASTANAIVNYRIAHGNYESLRQLQVIDGVTMAKVNDWVVSGDGESEYVIGLDGARELMVYSTIGDLLAALPDPSSPGAWEGTPIRVQRAAALDELDDATKQAFTFADWGDANEFEPTGGAQIDVLFDKDPSEGAYHRDQTNHANAMEDWIKEDGDPYHDPDFYRWPSPLWSFGRIAYAHVYALEGVVEVHEGSWRLRVRADTDVGIDRVVMIERWLDAEDWDELLVVWSYDYKCVVVAAVSGYSYSMPYRLVLAHPARQYWYDEHGEWIDIPRCHSFSECSGSGGWTEFDVALDAWKHAPVVGDGYSFTYDSVEYRFTTEEELTGLDILNNATHANLTDHCYTTTLANVVIANRPFASIADYDATSGVGAKSLWNLLACYVRSGHWPEALEGTVERVLQYIPETEYEHVTVDEADVTAISGQQVEICDPPGPMYEHCIKVYAYDASDLPGTLSVGDLVTVTGQVRYYTAGGNWNLTIGEAVDEVVVLEER